MAILILHLYLLNEIAVMSENNPNILNLSLQLS